MLGAWAVQARGWQLHSLLSEGTSCPASTRARRRGILSAFFPGCPLSPDSSDAGRVSERDNTGHDLSWEPDSGQDPKQPGIVAPLFPSPPGPVLR